MTTWSNRDRARRDQTRTIGHAERNSLPFCKLPSQRRIIRDARSVVRFLSTLQARLRQHASFAWQAPWPRFEIPGIETCRRWPSCLQDLVGIFPIQRWNVRRQTFRAEKARACKNSTRAEHLPRLARRDQPGAKFSDNDWKWRGESDGEKT
jgi:hypothetical protein